MEKNIIIVCDERCGESSHFRSMEEFKDFMLQSSDWTEETFQDFMDSAPEAEVYEAELVKPINNGGLYVYEKNMNMGYGRYEQMYVYNICYNDGSVKYIDTLDEEATPEEIEEISKI